MTECKHCRLGFIRDIAGEALYPCDQCEQGREIGKAINAEQARWQERLDKQIAAVYPDRDGTGCDSGDPLDVTDTELRQASDFMGAVAIVERDKLVEDNADLRSQIAALTAERDRLQAIVDELTAGTIHSCSDSCQRPMCVMRRERDAAIARAKARAGEISRLTKLNDEIFNKVAACGVDYIAFRRTITEQAKQISNLELQLNAIEVALCGRSGTFGDVVPYIKSHLDDAAKWHALPDSATWPHVLNFALHMERKLEKNRHKGDAEGWRKNSMETLRERLVEESKELARAILERPAEIVDEAADVANFAMMIADVATLSTKGGA